MVTPLQNVLARGHPSLASLNPMVVNVTPLSDGTLLHSRGAPTGDWKEQGRSVPQGMVLRCTLQAPVNQLN